MEASGFAHDNASRPRRATLDAESSAICQRQPGAGAEYETNRGIFVRVVPALAGVADQRLKYGLCLDGK